MEVGGGGGGGEEKGGKGGGRRKGGRRERSLEREIRRRGAVGKGGRGGLLRGERGSEMDEMSMVLGGWRL